MTLVRVARRVVVSTNMWPGLRTLYARAYDIGLSYAARRLGSVPGVLAVLLRTHGVKRTWSPGLSDYDLTLLIERHRGADAIRLLDAVWKRYRSIKSRVPQMGEMEVMNVDEYRDFLTFGPMATASLKRAWPLFVKSGDRDVAGVLRHEPRLARPRDVLLDALSRWGRFAGPACFEDAVRGNALRRRRAAHLVDSVVQRLAHIGVRVDHADTNVDRMILVCRALTETCRLLMPLESHAESAIQLSRRAVSPDRVGPIEGICADVLRRVSIPGCQVVIWTSYLDIGKPNVAFVIPDEVSSTTLRALLITVGAVHEQIPAFLCVATESMWRTWREMSAFDGIAVAASGRTLLGTDRGALIAPSTTAVRRDAARQYATLLALKNNWRLSRGLPTGHSFGTMINHADGYASAFTGRVLTIPAAFDCSTTLEGYLAAEKALERLRARLDPITDSPPPESFAHHDPDLARTAT